MPAKGRALIRKGFTELDARRVVANTMVVNLASRRVMEKAGMTLARTYHQEWPDVIEGGELGDVEYTLRKEDWEWMEIERLEDLEGEDRWARRQR